MLGYDEVMKKLGITFAEKSYKAKPCICATCFHYKACAGVDAEYRMGDVKCEADCDDYLNADEFLKCINIVQFGKIFDKGE